MMSKYAIGIVVLRKLPNILRAAFSCVRSHARAGDSEGAVIAPQWVVAAFSYAGVARCCSWVL
jgi:hypothetical protein